MEYIEKNWKKLLTLFIVTLLVIGGAVWFFRWQQRQQEILHEAQQVTQEQEQSIKGLQDKLQTSTDNATMLADKIGHIQAAGSTVKPNITFNVTAPTVQAAADDVQQRITAGDTTLPAAAIEQTDRTVVTPITQDETGQALPADQQKVDVYKINLRKDHRIKVGVTAVDGKAYPTIGYEQGRVEGLVHFDGCRPDGVTILYNVVEW